MAYDKSRISQPYYEILWVKFKDKYGSKVKLGGIYADKTGYHDARDGQGNNYSCVKTLDKKGPGSKASAIDWTYNDADLLHTHTKRLLKAYDNPRDKRIGPHNLAEFYGTTDGRTVVGRLHGRPASSDDSHLWHLHLAGHRAFIESEAFCEAVLSVVFGEDYDVWYAREGHQNTDTTEEDDMPLSETDAKLAANTLLQTRFKEYIDQDGNAVRDARTVADILFATHAAAVTGARAAAEQRQLAEATLTAVAGGSAEAILAEVRAQAEQTRQALAGQMEQIAPVLAAAVAERLGGEVSASEIGEALARELAAMLAVQG